MNKTALLKKQKEDLENVESKENNTGEDLTHAESDAKKNIDQIIDHARLRELEQNDQDLEKRIMGWKTEVEGVEKATPKGQESVGAHVDDIHR